MDVVAGDLTQVAKDCRRPSRAATQGATRRDARAMHRNPERPASTRRRGQTGPADVDAGLLAQHSIGRSVRFWTGPPPGQPPVPDQSGGPGPGRWSAAGPASADRPNPGRPSDPQRLNAVRQPGGAERGRFRAHRHPVDGPVWSARDAGAATASPGGRMRAAGKLRACARRGRRYADLPPGRMLRVDRRPGSRCDRAATRPARPIKAAGRYMARQPGSEGLEAGAVRAAIYDAA
jgi:hypothetical protein